MTQPKAERALEAAARALWDAEWPTWPQGFAGNAENCQLKARAAVAAYLESAPPEIRIGDFIIRHAGDRVWIGRSGGEGGEFATANVEAALAQFYHANF
jgi:hypothetical protein